MFQNIAKGRPDFFWIKLCSHTRMYPCTQHTHMYTYTHMYAGQRTSAACTGEGSLIPVTCIPCTASCGPGKRILASSRCNGTATTDITCMNCSRECEFDQYVYSECDGLGSEELGCATCKECAVGYYVAVPCDGTSRRDVKVRLTHVCRIVCMYMLLGIMWRCRVTGRVDVMLR
jgi:hypothetical protein